MSWQRVRGHDALVRAFDRAIRRGRLGHAYLFTGPPGIGKRLFARELARALLCENSPPGLLQACDHCAACAQVEAGTHPDFFTLSRSEDSLILSIDEVREWAGNLTLKPVRGHGRVAILNDADYLNEEGANFLLKTLEEPRPRSLLLLIGSSLDRLLPTIVSRCQIIRFAPLSEELVMELLHAQGVDDPALARRLARWSGGSPGQALELADPELWKFRRTLLEGLTRPRPDLVALAKSWTGFVEEAGKEADRQRRRASLVLRLLLDFFGAALCVQVGGAPPWLETEDVPLVQALADRVDADRLQGLIERCLEADFQIDRKVQVVLVLEALVDALGQKS